jgi:hypothetical protein
MWWIGVGALVWVVVAMAAALLIGRVVSHADFESGVEAIRRNSRHPHMRRAAMLRPGGHPPTG